MEFRQAMHVAIRHEPAHQVSERVAGTEFNNLGYAGGAAGLHAAGPVHRPLDLARQLVCTRVHIEHCGTVDPAQQPDPRRHRRRQVRLGQRLPEPIARISRRGVWLATATGSIFVRSAPATWASWTTASSAFLVPPTNIWSSPLTIAT